MMLQNVAHWLAVLVVKFQKHIYKFTSMWCWRWEISWDGRSLPLYFNMFILQSLGDPIFTKRRHQVSQQGIAWHSHVVAISATGCFFALLWKWCKPTSPNCSPSAAVQTFQTKLSKGSCRIGGEDNDSWNHMYIYIYIIHTKSAIKVCHVSWVSPCGPLPAGVSYHSKSPLSHPLGEYVLLFPSILSRKNVWNIPLAKLEDFHYAGQLSKTWRWGRGLTRISMFLHFFGSWTCLNQIYTYIYIY